MQRRAPPGEVMHRETMAEAADARQQLVWQQSSERDFRLAQARLV